MKYINELLEKYQNNQPDIQSLETDKTDRVIHNLDLIEKEKFFTQKGLLERKKHKSDSLDNELKSLSIKLSGWMKKTKSQSGRILISGLITLIVGSYFSREEIIKSSTLSFVKSYLSVLSKL